MQPATTMKLPPHLSFKRVFAGRRSGSCGECPSGVFFLHHGPAVQSGVAVGSAASGHYICAAAPHQPFGVRVPLLWVLQITLRQVGGKQRRTGLLVAGDAGLWNGWVRGRVWGAGVVYLGPHNGAGGRPCKDTRPKFSLCAFKTQC